MDKIPIEIKNIIDKYLFLLKINNILIKRVYLFGSFSTGHYHEYSDIDIALISDSFEGVRILDREKIRKITLSVSSKIEVIPFKTEDFTIENPFAKEIMRTGIELSIN